MKAEISRHKVGDLRHVGEHDQRHSNHAIDLIMCFFSFIV